MKISFRNDCNRKCEIITQYGSAGSRRKEARRDHSYHFLLIHLCLDAVQWMWSISPREANRRRPPLRIPQSRVWHLPDDNAAAVFRGPRMMQAAQWGNDKNIWCIVFTCLCETTLRQMVFVDKWFRKYFNIVTGQ